jgi:hypothetical protein
MQEFLENTAQLDESGKAFIIDMKGDKKYLNALGSSGKKLIEAEMANQATLKERAEAAQSFDEKITNLINMVKTYMMPIVEGIDDVLRPVIDDLFKDGSHFREDLKDLGKSLGGFVKGALEMLKPLGQLALYLGPKGLFAAFVGGKLLSGIVSLATWFANGRSLAKGFLMGTKGMGGTVDNSGKYGKKDGKIGPALPGKSGFGMKGMGAGAGAGLLTGGINAMSADSMGEGVGNVAGGVIGGILGTFLDPFIGPLGTMLGAQLGSMAGGAIGGYFSNEQHDALFNSPIHDGVSHGKSLGSDFSKKRGIVQGGKITPIDNKDDLLAMKPGGGVMKGLAEATKNKRSEKLKVEFGEIHFKFDDLLVKTSGGDSKNIGKELLNTASFTRDMTRMIHVETRKAINGGWTNG